MTLLLQLPAYVINLPRHTKRWDDTRKLLISIGLTDVRRFEAVDGSKLPRESLPISLYTKMLLQHPEERADHVHMNTVGQVGCALSHLRLAEQVVNNHESGAWIFEDDISVRNKQAFHEELQALPQHTYDIWVAGYLRKFSNQKQFNGTQAYYLTRAGAKKLLDKAYPLEFQIDGYMSVLNRLGLLNVQFARSDHFPQAMIKLSTTQSHVCWKCELPTRVYPVILVMVVISLLMTGLIWHFRARMCTVLGCSA